MTMTENLIQNACDNIDEQIRLYHEMIAKLGELKRGLLLADLIGRKPSEIKGVLKTSMISSNYGLRPWKDATLVVREVHPDGSETTQRFDLLRDKVHPDLWPEDMRHAYARYKAAKEKLARHQVVSDFP
jgi:hypothetical protein